MSEKVYLVTGSELANFSKEKITLALNWVISAAADHPELDVETLVSLLKENVNNVVGDTEAWQYGVTGLQEPVAELELPVAEEEPAVEETYSDNATEEEPEPVVDEYVPVVEDVYEFTTEDEDFTEDVATEEPGVAEEETVELVEVLAIDVENAILNVINAAESNQVTIDELRAGLGDAYTEEQFGQGFWSLVENTSIHFDDETGYISLATFEPSHAEKDEEEEPVVEETLEEETDFFSAPVVSRAKQYQGLFREAGQIDR